MFSIYADKCFVLNGLQKACLLKALIECTGRRFTSHEDQLVTKPMYIGCVIYYFTEPCVRNRLCGSCRNHPKSWDTLNIGTPLCFLKFFFSLLCSYILGNLGSFFFRYSYVLGHFKNQYICVSQLDYVEDHKLFFDNTGT